MGQLPTTTNRSANAKGNENPLSAFSPVDYLLIIRDRWLIGLLVAMIASGGFAYVKLQEVPLYSATTSIMIENTNERVVPIQEVVDTQVRSEGELRNHEATMLSWQFLSWAIDRIPEKRHADILAAYLSEDGPEPNLYEVVGSGREIFRQDGSFIFTVQFTHRDPKSAAFLANFISRSYINYLSERVGSGNARAIEFLEAQAEELRNKVEEGEIALQQYRQERSLVSLEESQNIILQRLQSISAALNNLELDYSSLEATLRSIEEADHDRGRLLSIPAIAGYGNLRGMVNELNQLKSDKEVLGQRYLEFHPRMETLDSRIQALDSLIERNIQDAISEVQDGSELLYRQIEELRNKQSLAEEENLALDETRIQFDIMRQNVALDRQILSSILRRLNEANVASQLEQSNVRILDYAGPPSKPVSPDQQKIATIAGGLFLGCFIGVPILLESLNNRVHTLWDVSEFLKQELLGTILECDKRKETELARAVSDLKDEILVENFRHIYGQAKLASGSEFPDSLLVTSTAPGEGKSVSAINLGATIAKHGKRVLVIDADFRRPSLHRYLEFENDHGFLRWWDSGKAVPTIEAFSAHPDLGIVEIATSLSLLRASGRTSDGSEIFDSIRFRDFIRQAKRAYDCVIIDSSPAGLFPEPFMLAKAVDAVLFVIRYNTVSRTRARSVVNRLAQTESPMLGVVLNGVPDKARKPGYAGSGYYSCDSAYDYRSYRDYQQHGERRLGDTA